MGRPPGGRSPPKRATVIGIKLKPAHKRGYIVITHKQIALLLAASLIQSYIFEAQISNSTPIRGSAPASCKERLLLTTLSSRRIRLHPANGSHCTARKTPSQSDFLTYLHQSRSSLLLAKNSLVSLNTTGLSNKSATKFGSAIRAFSVSAMSQATLSS
jgi:hypothetical protein